MLQRIVRKPTKNERRRPQMNASASSSPWTTIVKTDVVYVHQGAALANTPIEKFPKDNVFIWDSPREGTRRRDAMSRISLKKLDTLLNEGFLRAINKAYQFRSGT